MKITSNFINQALCTCTCSSESFVSVYFSELFQFFPKLNSKVCLKPPQEKSRKLKSFQGLKSTKKTWKENDFLRRTLPSWNSHHELKPTTRLIFFYCLTTRPSRVTFRSQAQNWYRLATIELPGPVFWSHSFDYRLKNGWMDSKITHFLCASCEDISRDMACPVIGFFYFSRLGFGFFYHTI